MQKLSDYIEYRRKGGSSPAGATSPSTEASVSTTPAALSTTAATVSTTTETVSMTAALAAAGLGVGTVGVTGPPISLLR